MGVGKPDAERGGTSTVEPGGRHQSARIPASLPASVSRLLDLAARTPPDAPVEQTLERLLDVLVEQEPGGAAGLRLPDQDLVIRRTASRLRGEPTEERLFPELAHECSAPLPDRPGAQLSFAAPSLTRASLESYRLLVNQAAAIISLILRGLDGGLVDSPRSGPVSEGPVSDLAQLHKLASLGQNASEIVHELSNPLTSILAYSDYLIQRLRHQGVGEADLDRLQRIHEAATRIQRFTRDLSHYAKPSATLHASVDLHAVIDRALRFCVHGLRSTDISVERSYGDVSSVLGEESALTQVFVNLITNAWHAMDDEGGVLRIATISRPEWVVVEVADDGHGIAPEAIDRIFDQYFTTKGRDEGSGLGLSIVRQIIIEHGGYIEARNREPNGAVFSLYFPRPD
jgi:signal transduction histidine kinase